MADGEDIGVDILNEFRSAMRKRIQSFINSSAQPEVEKKPYPTFEELRKRGTSYILSEGKVYRVTVIETQEKPKT